MSITQEQRGLLELAANWCTGHADCVDSKLIVKAGEFLRQYIQQSPQAAPQAEQAADMVRPSESLRARCEEALEWNKTGYLRDGHLRALARSQPHAEEHHRLKGAESVTSDEAMRFVLAAATQPQQAKEGG